MNPNSPGRGLRRLARTLARPFDTEGVGRLEESVAARLRAAQLAPIMRYSPGMATANVLIAILVAGVLAQRPDQKGGWLWLAAVLAYFAPLVVNLSRRRRKAPPSEIGPGPIRRAVIHACVLGTIWGAAPAFFFDASQPDQLLIACVAVGMLSGGALALATLPQALVAYAIPLGFGSLIGLLHGGHGATHLVIVPLLFIYFLVIVLAALAHSRQFARRVVAQAFAESAARHDPLTGLPNRTAFNAELAEAYRRLDRYGEKFALLYIDLDDFKAVNDRLGHLAGDQLLLQMAGRLAGKLRDKDILCRLGGDEFVLLARGLSDAHDASAMAAALALVFDPPFVLDGGSAYCRASVGVALAPADGDTPAALVAHADAALYMAKRDRAFRAHLYRAGEDIETRDRRALAADMKGALARGEFFLEFQPIVELASGRIEANEALVRWRHPVHGLVPPSLFVPVAEQSGAIHELGEWIMYEACRTARLWPDDVRVAVNVSADQICDRSIVAIVQGALREAKLAPERLHVEVTESAALGSALGTAAALDQLHEIGAAIVLDDFGTGFSSFDHIRRLQVSRLKIDRSFVADLPERKSMAIVQSVAHLARMLEIEVTAEGIETAMQLELLKAAGCGSGQGYLLSRPQDGAAILELLRRRSAA